MSDSPTEIWRFFASAGTAADDPDAALDTWQRRKNSNQTRLHPLLHKHAQLEFFSGGTFATWFTASAFLVSFGVLINNTNKTGEPKASTAMCSLGMILLLWASVVFFRSNWHIQHRPAMFFLLFIVIVFIFTTIWLIVRIWVTF